MPSIKENIKEELLKKINEQKERINKRISLAFNTEELYQISCEKRFIGELEEFVKSL